MELHNIIQTKLATRIRLGNPDELEVLHHIVRDAIQDMVEHGILQWDEIYPSKEILSQDLKGHDTHIIEVEDHVAGFIVMNEDQSPEYASISWKYHGRALVIHRLTIQPKYQHNGLATRLMDFAEKTAAIGGFDCIRLDAFTLNPAAVNLYENRGYRKAGKVRFRKGEFYCYEKAIKL